MAVPLVVVLGAGASRGAGDFVGASAPPLTLDLFDESQYGRLLETYDLAHQAGRYIARQQAGDTALALERALNELRLSTFSHHRHMAVAVPFYLQDLLHGVSDQLHRQAFRYDHLIEQLLRLPYVYFVTLNYDVLLDRRLASYYPLNSPWDYIEGNKNWALIKLHGSVNWYRKSIEPLDPASPPSDLDLYQGIDCLPPAASLQEIRNSTGGETDRYPVLALPEGPEDELVAPPTHINFIERELSSFHQFDLLVIGYSGLDEAVLGLLNRRRSDLRRMTIVNTGLATASEVLLRLQNAGVKAVWPSAFHGDFAEWADHGYLDKLVSEYDGPYSDFQR
jgi:hypothetical protein